MRQGDVAILGHHRLVCGDAFNPEHVDLLMDGDRAGMLYCDPPYGVALKTNYRRNIKWDGFSTGKQTIGGKRRITHDHTPVIGDTQEFDPSALISAFHDCKEHFWWGADYYRQHLPNGGSWIVWDKRKEGGMDRMWGSCFELCFSLKQHKRSIARIAWVGVSGMVAKEGDDRRYHPTQKPVRLAEWFLERYSKPAAIVVDLFAGSGSTLLACERMGRQARVMEIDPGYCDVIIDRWEKLTGQRAVIGREEVAA